ncbi:hypothetical protein F0562_001567 [Nyssa sinensis]|uniref:Uncharacterized protein n=1 Tax=Nyssa sinensis TaxID=561372 RepID=A0A5J5C3B6_9ASTE|nr:hypothetical protein F0562_001567 [Nyssa sinensis]
MTIHVDLKLVFPQKHLGRALNIHRSLQSHLSPPHVGEELREVMGQLEPAEPSREVEDLAGAWRLGAGADLSRTEEAAGVEDGHLGGGVVDGDGVGVGDVYGQEDKSEVVFEFQRD